MKRYISGLIIFLGICGISTLSLRAFSQEEVPEPPPEKSIEEMLADENMPEDLKKELGEMYMKGEFEEVPVQIGPTYEEPPPQAAQAESKIAPPAKQDNKISLDLKGVDIIDVLKMLSTRSNLNIVAGRNVRGKVTLFLKDVDVWDAFEIILAANDLAYEKDDNIINVMTERDYEQLYGERCYDKKETRIYKLEYAKASEASKALNQAKSKIGKVIVDEGSNTIVVIDSLKAIAEMEGMIKEIDMPTEMKVFSLNYAKSEDVKTKISEILTKGVGTIQEDKRTNKIVVTDLVKRMPEIAKVIAEMDEKHKEVLIEAKIVQVELKDEFQYGIDWKAAFKEMGEQGIRFDFDNLGNIVSGTATTGGVGVTLASVASRNIEGVLGALKAIGKTNVISAPRLTVLNNEEAKVLVGTNQPYVESTTTGTDPVTTSNTVKYIDLGISLAVTPTINNDGYVTMKIKPEISSSTDSIETAHAATETGNTIPIVSTSKTETTVMVKDGHTIIMAGLIEDRDQFQEEKVPILGDMPLIGNLFKKTTKGSVSAETGLPEKRELVIFLTPYIIHGTETFPEAENVWYGDKITQRELLEKQISLAVADLQKHSVVGEVPPPEKVKDTTTRISEDITWLKVPGGKLKEKKEAEGAKEGKPEKEAGKEAVIPPSELTLSPISGYYSYFEMLRNKIYWVAKDTYPKDFKGEKKDVIVLFKLTNEGALKSTPKVLNEVDEELASAAKAAVEKAAPFPPFPRRMDKDEEIFKITVTYR